MAKLIITRGLPASGKSTFARDWVAEDPENRARVNRDELRKLVHDGRYIKGSKDNPGTEQTIIAAELAMVKRFLEAGLDVVDDNTNLPNRSVKQLVEVAEKVGAEWQVVDFTDVPVEEVLRRSQLRNARRLRSDVYAEEGEPLPDAVINDLHQKFVKGKPYPLPFEHTPKPELTVEPYEPNPFKRRAVIVDLDGTVALNDGHRGFHDYDQVAGDKPNWPVIQLVKQLQITGHEILFTSGRKDYCREKTITWLREYIFPSGHFELFMRKTEDNRKDYVVKLELFNRYIRDEYNVRLVLDDRNQVVEMWRKLGLTCLQVADGDF